MIEVCQMYSLDELIALDDTDMDRMMTFYAEGITPQFSEIHRTTPLYEFDGSFGWHC